MKLPKDSFFIKHRIKPITTVFPATTDLGDYLAIAKGNKALLYKGDKELLSLHAGYTEDEVLVPLIVIEID